MTTLREKLSKLAANNTSSWLEESKWYVANEKWLDKSAKIALKILRHIRKEKIKQTQLAEMLGVTAQNVSKILKGKENLTLETIAKFESVLGISLIDIPITETSFEYSASDVYLTSDYEESTSSSSESIEYTKAVNNTISAPLRKGYGLVA